MSVVRPRLHCHSAYKHYQMFHSNYESSYGNSVFNYTYNFNGGNICGGGFWGGFWGGIGMGIGNFLGGLFGGFGMGGFGSFGMGGFGNFSFSPFGIWGGGASRQAEGAGGRETRTHRRNHEPEANTPTADNSQPTKNPSSDTIQPVAPVNEDETDELKGLLTKYNLDPKAPDFDEKFNDVIEDEQTPIEDLEKFKGLKSLTEAQRKSLEEAIMNRNKVGNPDDDKSDYLQGYRNIKGEELTTVLTNGAIIDVIDISDVEDMLNCTIEGYDKDEQIITIKRQNGKQVRYQLYSDENGELRFESDKNRQVYVLQTNGDRLGLIQYEGFDGYNIPDVTQKNENKQNEFLRRKQN